MSKSVVPAAAARAKNLGRNSKKLIKRQEEQRTAEEDPKQSGEEDASKLHASRGDDSSQHTMLTGDATFASALMDASAGQTTSTYGTTTDDDDDDDGAALLIVGAVILLGGGLALALGGGGNDAPTFSGGASQAVSTTEDKAVTVTAAATDPDNDALTYSVSTAPGKGTVAAGAGGTFTYTPNANYNGSDSFVVSVTDGNNHTVTQTINVTVSAVNDVPTVAAAQTVSGTEDTALAVAVTGAADVDGDTLAYSVSTAAKSGTVTGGAADGKFTYTPNANFNGTDSFVVTVADGKGGTATQTVTVNLAAVNDAPSVAAAQTLNANEDAVVAVTVAAADVDGDTLAYAVSTAAKSGTVTGGTGGKYTYTPNANFSGTDSFVVTVTDGKGGSSSQTVTINLAAVNDAPTMPASQAVNVNEDGTIAGAVAATDVEGDTIAYTLTTKAANGTATLGADGKFSYTPNANFSGTDSFVVTATDSKGAAATQTINLTVAAVNDAPVVNASSAIAVTVDEDQKVGFTVSAVDPDGQQVYIRFSDPPHGQIKVLSFGSYEYCPDPDYFGPDSFEVIITDFNPDEAGATGATTRYTVNATVNSVPDSISIDVGTNAAAVSFDATAGQLTYLDNSALTTNVVINGMATGDLIQVTGSSSDYSFSSIGNDIVISFNNQAAGVLNTITLPGLAAAGGFINNEATAELVAGFNFFTALTQPNGGGGTGDGIAVLNGNLDDDNDANVNTFAVTSAASGDIAYTESAIISNSVNITNFTKGDTITVSGAPLAAYSFSSNGSGDVEIVYNNSSSGVLNVIKLIGANTSGAQINSEATAEAAIGSNFFLAEATPAPGTNVSADVGTNVAAATLNASTGSFNYTDNAAAASNVIITGFTNNDLVTVTNAQQSDYSFTTLDGQDLQISYNNSAAGVLNTIVLDNVLTSSAFIFDYASASKAVGFNFMTFA